MTPPFIQFKDIEKQFGNNRVLRGVNLSVFESEIFVIIGKSGTGKSVLLKHMIGLIEPDKGDILIHGKPLKTLSRKERNQFQSTLSYMFQDNALFDSLNIYDNIALPLKETAGHPKDAIKDKVLTRMNQLGLSGIQDQFPSQLSGGMRKRVALARALVVDPQVVLFDEPTTGLDPVRRKSVHRMICEYQRQFGFTAVIVTHDIPEIFNIAQRIAMLDQGEIKFEGDKRALQTSKNPILYQFINGEDY